MFASVKWYSGARQWCSAQYKGIVTLLIIKLFIPSTSIASIHLILTTYFEDTRGRPRYMTITMADKSIVLVTGGNTGVGYETVKALYASSVAHVVLMGSRSLENADAAIKKLQAEVPDSTSEVIPIQIDIEDDASIDRLNKDIESKFGRLDVLVNNAGKQDES